jgi:ABC-type spermidine/putrescine transport system permease subunit II
MIVALLLPNVIVMLMSLTTGDFMTFPPRDPSLKWYLVFLQDPEWTEPLLVSAAIGAAVATVATAVGSLAAWPLSRMRLRSNGPLRAFLLSPLVVPPIALAVGTYLSWVRIGLLGNPISIVVTHAIQAAPFAIVVVGAAFSGIHLEQLRAARSLGAGHVALAARVIVPVVLPSMLAAWVFALAVSLDEVVLTRYLLVAGQTPTLGVYLLSQLQFSLTPAVAAVSTANTALALAIAMVAAARLQKAAD